MSHHPAVRFRVPLTLFLVLQIILPLGAVSPPPVAIAAEAAAATDPVLEQTSPAGQHPALPRLAIADATAQLAPVAEPVVPERLPVALSLQAKPVQAEPGQVVTYTVTATNAAETVLQDITLTDVLPPGLTYVPDSGWGFEFDPRKNRLTRQIAEFRPGQTLTGSFQTRVTGLEIGQSVTNTVVANSVAVADTVTASISIEVVAPRADQAWITPEQGGWLRTTDGRVTLHFPPGAVKNRTRISYAALAEVPAKYDQMRFAFSLEAADQAGQPVQRFDQALVLTYAYPPRESKPPVYEEPALFYWDAAQGAWTQIPAELDSQAGLLRASLDHFSIYSEGSVSYIQERMSSVRGAQTNLATLSIGYAYDLELPPGRGGLTPQLGLRYTSANHTPNSGHFSYVGFGWELVGADSVYTAPGDSFQDEPTLTLQGRTYSLRKTNEGRWFAKEDPLLKIETDGTPNPATWNVWTRDGTRYTFSASSVSAHYWKNCASSPYKRRVRVPLVSIQDPYTNTNTINYTWAAEPYTSTFECRQNPTTDQFDHALRLTSITYDGDNVLVELGYASRADRADGWNTAAWRFFTDQRLDTVTVKAKDTASGAFRTVRSYQLHQVSGTASTETQKVLNLDWVEERSASGNPLPRTTFSYTDDYFPDAAEYGALLTVGNGYGGEVAFAAQHRNGGSTPYVVITRTERAGITGVPDAVWGYAFQWDDSGAGFSPPLPQGCKVVTVTLPGGGTEIHYFHVLSDLGPATKIDHLFGLEYKQLLKAGANEINRVETTWISTTQSLPLGNYSSMPDDQEPRFVHAAQVDTYQEGVPRLRIKYEYDIFRQGNQQQYGNVTQKREYVARNNQWSEPPLRTTYTVYYPNPTAWIISRPAWADLYEGCYGCNPQVVKQQSFYYYDQTASYTTPPSKGLLRQEVHGLGSDWQATQYEYWSNGNLRKVIDGNGRATETFYDSLFQAFPVCVKNARGHLTKTRYYNVPGSTESGCPTNTGEAAWNSSGVPITGHFFGQVNDVTDPNAALTSVHYDEWGRVTQVWNPRESQAAGNAASEVVAYTNYSSSSAPFKVQVRTRDDPSGGAAAATYLER